LVVRLVVGVSKVSERGVDSMLRLIKNAWIRTLIAFDVQDPLQRTGKAFVLPDNFNSLDTQSKTRASICNLFGNLQQPIDQLARLYDMPRDRVVSILLEERLLEDKRQNRSDVIKGGRRRTDH
jgi:hypothetical protein